MILVEFLSSGSLIRGYLFPAAHDPIIASVIFLQGFPGIEGDELICERLCQEGVNVLTFNYRGTFRSEGCFSFSNAIADIGAAIQFLKEPKNQASYRIDPGQIILGGWSFGSGIVPAGSVQYPEIRKIFTISGRDFGKEAQRICQDPEYAREVAKNLEGIRAPQGPVHYGDDLLSDLINNRERFDTSRLAALLNDREILLIGGWNDSVSAIEDHVIPFYRLLMKNHAAKVRIEALQDDHEFPNNRERLVKIIVEWLQGKSFPYRP